MEAIDRRRSVREYAAQPLPQESLSRLLWATQGIKRVMPGVATLRTVPSAGARHALETFVLANSVEGLEPGLYRYVASRHSLVARDNSPGVAQRAVKACLGQRFVESSAATFVWAAVPYRMTWRYGERGYRYLYLDAGHVCQNLYLAAESIGCGVCAIAAFDDEAMDRLVGADGFELFAIYVATVGYPGHPRR
jgi:SagB-type dehydrogenase family enzyme